MMGSKNYQRRSRALHKFVESLHALEARQHSLKQLIVICHQLGFDNKKLIGERETFSRLVLECRARRTTLNLYNQLLTLRRGIS